MVFSGKSTMIDVGEDREVDDPERLVATVGRLPDHEVLPDPRGHRHAPGAQPHPDRLTQRGTSSASPDSPHLMGQVQGVAAPHQQRIALRDALDANSSGRGWAVR